MGIILHVISGLAKRTKLLPIKKLNIRPTLGHIKEAIFNIIMFGVKDCVFLDLFSGTGAIGLEALSRGSSRVVFVEKNLECIDLIKKNLEVTKLNRLNRSEIIHGDALEIIKNLAHKKIFFDIIFVDPPYYKKIACSILEVLSKNNILSENGIIICETGLETLSEIEIFDFFRCERYGKTKINFIRRRKN